MTDPRTRFFDNMERELLDEIVSGTSQADDSIDVEFLVTESGRSVLSHRRTLSNLEEYPCDSLRTLDPNEQTSLPSSPRPYNATEITHSERSEISETQPNNLDEYPCDSLRSLDGVVPDEQHGIRTPTIKPPLAKSIPVPKPTHSSFQSQSAIRLPSSQPNSQGSTGSAFLASVLNNNPSQSNQKLAVSHTPPAVSASYEHQFGKRFRVGSVSGRLRSASELFDEKQLDKNTKCLLKDLILIGDEQVQEALDQFENTGNSTLLEQMIASGTLQHRLPADLDLLDDLDLDFLNVHEDLGMSSAGGAVSLEKPVSIWAHNHAGLPLASKMTTTAGGSTLPSSVTSEGERSLAQRASPSTSYSVFQHPSTTKPFENDDGVGDFEFNEFAADDYSYYGSVVNTGGAHVVTKQILRSCHGSLGTSPPDMNLSDYEQRLRSNSLFSALLNENTQRDDSLEATQLKLLPLSTALHSSYSSPKELGPGITLNATNRTVPNGGGIAASLLAAAAATHELSDSVTVSNRMQDESMTAKNERSPPISKRVGRIPKDKKKDLLIARKEQHPPFDGIELAHISGSGKPRPITDPSIKTSFDSFGFRVVERPDGWIGAYSPDSRKLRIEKFLAKRNHRVWSKTIKYDVRKNFADSRLRVKGRFVRKEDELLMRELLSLT